MEVWAEAMRSLNNADETTDLNLVLQVIDGNNTIPVIVSDDAGDIQTSRNIDCDDLAQLQALARQWKKAGQAIRIDLENGAWLDVCYDESLMIKRLSTYPYVQLGVVLLFVVIAIFALLTSKKAEQNKVWVGLSKETAHQLGTPISSLMAWAGRQILEDRFASRACRLVAHGGHGACHIIYGAQDIKESRHGA